MGQITDFSTFVAKIGRKRGWLECGHVPIQWYRPSDATGLKLNLKK